MGVPKFFRWLSERYPKINQRYGSPVNPETYAKYFNDESSTTSPSPPPPPFEEPDPMATCGLPPEIDRLYIDMNGIIHGCSHNNSEDNEDVVEENGPPTGGSRRKSGGPGGGPGGGTGGGRRSSTSSTPQPTHDEIFRNVCYYLDRIVSDLVQPQELVYLAIDGVAPRAKLNQQRARRYRTGNNVEGEIEFSIYEAHAKALESQQQQQQKEAFGDNDIYEDGDEPLRRSSSPSAAAARFASDGNKNMYSFVLDHQEGNRLPSDQMESEETMTGAGDGGGSRRRKKDSASSSANGGAMNDETNDLQEVAPGRFTGKIETHISRDNDVDSEDDDNIKTKNAPTQQSNGEASSSSQSKSYFHSNVITPGTPFFAEFTKHLEHFVKYKLSTDPKWKNLTIIFSGSNVPGEGEHKIMQFIREQKEDTERYNPNLRHCIMGQDGDLIMLGLATHEPNMVLLRERVVFNITKERLTVAASSYALDSYIHNPHFEFLHMGVLRDYLAYEFETSNVLSSSSWDLEHTIDDFVFLTFFVGNDFLPHMPALDIGDNAFDLLFFAYKQCRKEWLNESKHTLPYITNAGNIVSGRRLEHFLSAVGSHEVAYYDKKKQQAENENRRLRKTYKRFGMRDVLPRDSLIASKEASDRLAYRKMLEDAGEMVAGDNSLGREGIEANGFQPVLTSDVEFEPVEEELEEGLISRMGSLLQNSLSSNISGSDDEETAAKYQLASIDDQDLKGRYYYDKFQFTPFDQDKHLALRKAYIEGLVWNLKYYYSGCVSWEWYYPYHYGPMLSDLVNLDELLDQVNFDDKLGTPLKPFEQLLGCMPPSQARHLPKPYRALMTSPDSPIIDFYPTSFVVDMNGKRWPWEAVTLLPFIDSTRLLEAVATVDQNLLTDEERQRNSTGRAVVMTHDAKFKEPVKGIGSMECFQEIESCTAVSIPFENSNWVYNSDKPAVLKPTIQPGTQYPQPGFGTLRIAPVQSLRRKKLGINVFGSKSRYRTSCLEISSLMPPLPPIEMVAPKLIGTTIPINYPYCVEGLVTAVSDERVTIRGQQEPRMWTEEEATLWRVQRDGVIRRAATGEGFTGTGGMLVPDDKAFSLSVRPMQSLIKTADGRVAKAFAKFEVEVPLLSTFWVPARLDARLDGIPSRLEKNAYDIAMNARPDAVANPKSKPNKGSAKPKRKKLFPAKPKPRRGVSACTRDVTGQDTTKASAACYSTLSSTRPTTRRSIPSPFPLDARAKRSLSAWSSVRSASAASRTFDTAMPSFVGVFDQRRINRFNSVSRSSGRPGRLMAAGLVFATAASLWNSSNFAAAMDGFDIRQLQPTVPSNVAPMDFEQDVDNVSSLSRLWPSTFARGGDVGEESLSPFGSSLRVPPLQFAHGTTTLSFSFRGGIIAAVDSRASIGNFVGSKTTQKVLPVNSHMLGTMAGGAADCQHWIRKLQAQALLHELAEEHEMDDHGDYEGDKSTIRRGRRMSVARASRILSNILYATRPFGLSVGTMIMGYDDDPLVDEATATPHIYYIDNTGVRIHGDLFAVGSGASFALGILDTEGTHQFRYNEMTVDEAIALGIKAIRHATFRDAYSGGYINVYVITPGNGWKRVYQEDIARSPDAWQALHPKDEALDHLGERET